MGANKMFYRVSLFLLAGIAMGVSAQARTVTLDHLMPTIRLCPVSCISVSGHKLRNGNKVQVLQVRSGWARVSPLLDAEKLKRSFGARVPEKPAYWVELSRTSGLKVTEERLKPAAKKKISVRQERRITVPVARPDFAVASLQASETSMIVNALATDPQETVRASEAVVAKVESTARPIRRNDGAPVAVSFPDNRSERALTTDKMTAWIAANRSEVIEDVDNIPNVAKTNTPVASGKALEKQIVALKTPDDTSSQFGAAPEVMTSELLDKRLNILPGMNSKVPEEMVIALRHYALGLLNSKACKGIAGGGAGEKTGTIYLVCTDDLTRIREFSVSQEFSGALN